MISSAKQAPRAAGEYISAAEVGRRVGVSAETVLSWARRGRIPRHRPLSGNRVLFIFEEVVAALKATGREEVGLEG